MENGDDGIEVPTKVNGAVENVVVLRDISMTEFEMRGPPTHGE